MEQLVTAAVIAAIALATSGCSGVTENGSSASTAPEATSATASKENETKESGTKGNDAITIDEIDWTVDESIINGERYVAFSYTNNSPYTIVALEIDFQQREDVTDEQRSVFDPLYENEYWDHEPSELYIKAYTERLVEPGDTSIDVPCSMNGTLTPVSNLEQYELMEPDTMGVAYIGSDQRIYMEYYDFKSEKYSSDTRSGVPAKDWPEHELMDLAPSVDAPVITVEWDSENDVMIETSASGRESFDSYVQACKDAGFTDVVYSYDGYYAATNADDVEISVEYLTSRDGIRVGVSN